MSTLWVKFQNFSTAKISTEGCQDVYDFLEACKNKLPNLLGSYDSAQLSLSTAGDDTPLPPDDPLPAQNTAKTPLFISIIVVEEMKYMTFGEATMPFISETTDVKEKDEVWKNIPIDTKINPSEEFIELFKKNCSVFQIGSEASRRTVIDLFLREVVFQFPDFMIICEYNMAVVNETKRRKLNGQCDYSICHRLEKDYPHLIAIEAKIEGKDSKLQCIGECASIHYRRKMDKKENLCVYGIHSTGSKWSFIFIDENGNVLVSKDYELALKTFDKKQFYTIYRLVYYVVQQSCINSPRSTPSGSSESSSQ